MTGRRRGGHGSGGAPGGSRDGGSRDGGARDAGTRGGPKAGERSWVIGFVLRLLLGWGIAIGLLALAPGVERWTVMATVGSVAAALRLGALHPQISGATIMLGDNALIIIPECTPLMPVLLLAIAMIAYPAPARWKLAGIGAGIAALWIFNVVRMLALFGTMVWWPASFKFMHVYLWQSITLLVVSGLFMAWLRFSPPEPARA